jgi:glutathione S-transferase
VRIFLAEKGVEIETEQVDLGSGEQFSEDFRKVNPDCVVPALVLDDGTCLSEAIAICQYLEDLYPAPVLFGSSPEERALVSMWNAKIEQQGLWSVMDALRNFARSFKGKALSGLDSYEQIPELAERGRLRAERFFRRLDAQLSDHRYVAGDRFSVADITALVFVDFARWVKLEIPEDAEHLRRWHAEVSSRSSAGA